MTLIGVASVLAGFFTMAIIVSFGTMAMMAAFVPGGIAAMRAMRNAGAGGGEVPPMPTPTPRYYVLNILLSFIAALIGGIVTGKIAHNDSNYVAALAILTLVMGVVSALVPSAKRQPMWYKLVIPVIGAAGVAASLLV